MHRATANNSVLSTMHVRSLRVKQRSTLPFSRATAASFAAALSRSPSRRGEHAMLDSAVPALLPVHRVDPLQPSADSRQRGLVRFGCRPPMSACGSQLRRTSGGRGSGVASLPDVAIGHGSAVARVTIRPVGMSNVRARRPHRSSAAVVHDDDAYPPLESGLQVPPARARSRATRRRGPARSVRGDWTGRAAHRYLPGTRRDHRPGFRPLVHHFFHIRVDDRPPSGGTSKTTAGGGPKQFRCSGSRARRPRSPVRRECLCTCRGARVTRRERCCMTSPVSGGSFGCGRRWHLD